MIRKNNPDENVRYRLQASSLGACYNPTWELCGAEGFRSPFVPAWRGLSGSGAWGSCVQQAPLDCFRVLPFCGLKVWKDRAEGPGKGELGGLFTVFEQPMFVAKSPEAVAVLTFYGYR